MDVDRLMGTAWPSRWKDALVRPEALAQFAPDPRICRGLCVAARRYHSMGSRPFHSAVSILIAQWPDSGCAADLGDLTASRLFGIGEYGTAIAALDAFEPGESSAADLQLAHSIPGDVDVDALWAAVWERPEDEVARLVLTDALQQAGDPRGEFIALQFDDSKAAVRQANALLKTYATEWGGAMPGVEKKSRRFARGFLTSTELAAEPRAIRASLSCPEWRTLEHLVIGGYGIPGQWLLPKTPVLKTLGAARETGLPLLDGRADDEFFESAGAWLGR